MKNTIRFCASILILTALFAFPLTANAASRSPFVGHWQAIDVDGSDIRLAIGGPANGPFRITWTESYISFCGGDAGIIRGTGRLVDSDMLTADLHLECFTTGDSLDFSATWVYDPGTDTISSDFITWHRPNAHSKACVPPPSGLIAWWPGDGDAHELIAGRGGAFHGEATTGSGLVNLAFRLDGDGDFVDVPHDPALNVGISDFTVDLWVNFNATSGEQVLVEKWIQGDPLAQGWTLTKLENDILRLAMATGTGDEVNLDTEPLSIRPGIWYHIAATRQGSVVTLYMNGVAIAHNPELGALNLNSVSSLKLGHRGDPEDTPGSIDERGFYLVGRIDEVELFVGTALSADQIMAIYQAGSAGKCKDAIQPFPALNLRLNYGHDWVEGFYEAGHVVWITVTESDGLTVKASAELHTEPKDFWGGETGFTTQPEDWNPAPLDIQPYDWVYGWVDNGASAQVQVGDIRGAIDLAGDSIQGTISAPWFSEAVNVECHPWGAPEPVEMKFDTIQPDGVDSYSCSWAGEWDIQPNQDVGVGYYGADGHWVANAFFVPNSRIIASIAGDWFWTTEFKPGTLNLFIYESATEGAALLWQGSREADEAGFVFVGYEDHGLDLVPGNYLVVSDERIEKGLVLETITMEVFDTENEIMAGTAPAGRAVWANAGEQTFHQTIVVTADANGAWLADYKSIGFDITEAMRAGSFAHILDEDGDANEAGTPPPPAAPWLRAHPVWDSVDAWSWPQEAVLHLTIDDPATPAAPDLEMDMPGEVDPELGSVWFDFAGAYDLKAGDEVTLSDGTTIRYLVVAVLMIDAVDVEADTATGTAEAGASLRLPTPGEALFVTADSNGYWFADFRQVGFDLLPGMMAIAEVFDDDGDLTSFEWHMPNSQ